MYNYLCFFSTNGNRFFLLKITQKKWRYFSKYLRKNH